MKKDSIVARVTIKAPGKMTPAGRRRIAKWLQRQAEDLMEHGKKYTIGRFSGRFIIDPVLAVLVLGASPVFAADEDPCGTVLAPKGCASLTAGAVSVITRDQKREFATVGGSF